MKRSVRNSARMLFGIQIPAKRKPAVIVVTHPHAILDSSRRVMMIRQYPRTTRSNVVIPIPDDQKCRVGWYWDGKRFQENPP